MKSNVCLAKMQSCRRQVLADACAHLASKNTDGCLTINDCKTERCGCFRRTIKPRCTLEYLNDDRYEVLQAGNGFGSVPLLRS